MSTPVLSQPPLQQHRQAMVFHLERLRDDGAVVLLPRSQVGYVGVVA